MVYLEDGQWEELRKEAFEKKVTISAVVRARLFESTIVSAPEDGPTIPSGLEKLVNFESSLPAPKPGKK
jgi:hypothetical protein